VIHPKHVCEGIAILDEPWVIAARHRSGKTTTVLNMFKTVVASRDTAPIFTARPHCSQCKPL